MPEIPHRLLQQFARRPVLGAVKTRLAKSIGDEAALKVHRRLMECTGNALITSNLGPVELWVDGPGSDATIDRLLNRGLAGPRIQSGTDLGERMTAALEDGLRRARAVVLVGSDCPGLDAAYLRGAFDALESADVVLGPAEDGGFVLIGARRLPPRFLGGVAWGQSGVLREVREQAKAVGLSSILLAQRYDIDELADLRRWRAADASVGLSDG